jgi:hypothetical protein
MGGPAQRGTAKVINRMKETSFFKKDLSEELGTPNLTVKRAGPEEKRPGFPENLKPFERLGFQAKNTQCKPKISFKVG